MSCEEDVTTSPFHSDYDPSIWTPFNLEIEQYSISKVKLSWEQNEKNISGFKIDKKNGNDNWQTAYDTVESHYNIWIDNSPSLSDINYYRLYAYADSYTSSSVEASIALSFSAPANLQFEQLSASSIKLTWSDLSNGESGFIINRKKQNEDWVTGYGQVESNVTEWTDDSVNYEDVDDYLYYQVYAFYDNTFTSPIEGSKKVLYMSNYIDIPGDYPRFVDAIDAAQEGDTILVYFGTYSIEYPDQIWFENKNLVMGSFYMISNDESHIDQTVIQGSMIFKDGIDTTTVVRGFTISDKYGITCWNGSPILTDLIISNNSRGIKFSNSNAIIKNITISNNVITTQENGGGILCTNNSNPTINNVLITNNTAYRGGGIACSNSNPIITNVKISDNSSISGGGGIFLNDGAMPILNNVIITGNRTTGGAEWSFGGALCCYNAKPTLNNVVISDNYASNHPSGAFYCSNGSELIIINSIIRESYSSIYFNMWEEANSIIFSYSNIQNLENSVTQNYNPFPFPFPLNGTVTFEIGNIDMDPIFTGNDNYQLQASSPCIDSGDPDSKYNDIDDSRNDMGAYGGPFGNW